MLSRRRRANKRLDNGAFLYFLIRLIEVRMFGFHCLFGYMRKRSKRFLLVCWLCFLGMVVEKARIYRSLPEFSSYSRSYWNIPLADVSDRSEKESVMSDVPIQYDGKKNRLIIIYSLQDEQQWTHPTNNYSYPPWYYLCYSII